VASRVGGEPGEDGFLGLCCMGASAEKPRQCEVPHVANATPAPASAWGGRWEVRMRKIGSFAIVAGLILAATGFGVWAASRTTNHAKAGAKGVNVEDTREGIPVGGGLFIVPPVY
jgi:hypothetical protein